MRIYWDKFWSNNITLDGKHHSSECTKTLSEAPKCANCSGAHTANFSKCPSLESYLQVRQNNNKDTRGIALLPPAAAPAQTLPPLASAVPSPAATARGTYANITAGVQHSVPYNTSPSPMLGDGIDTMVELAEAMKELNSLVNVDQMLSLTRALIQRLRTFNSTAEKFQAFWSIFNNID